MKKILTILVWICYLNGYGQAAGNETVDKLFSAWDSAQSPGAAVGIVSDGKLLYAKGYGMADLEHDIAITPATTVAWGSLSCSSWMTPSAS